MAKEKIRVAALQCGMRRVASAEEFEKRLDDFTAAAAGDGTDFILYPELLTLCLLSAAEKKLSLAEGVAALSDYTPRWQEFLKNLAAKHNINIIGGSHLHKDAEGAVRNSCYIALRDGGFVTQDKLHPTPNEAGCWHLQGGDTLRVIKTDCGPIGVLICYDSEFPEAARKLADDGAEILFVPFCTDERQGYYRVRYCCHARTVENQYYVVAAGGTGYLENVENADHHYAESCILTPCDYGFAKDGIAAIAAAEEEALIAADLDIPALHKARTSGTVQNLKDRRTDLYDMSWK
ncbi:MAG: carbon-nitrogen hydrolase family protein [Pseudomonadota bacterium]|nr:MAG: carbon-nitrogen hydrolase family protein [Pseudomonadota bacterium]